MSMYKQLQTDPALEKKGVETNYGTFRVTLARAGGANKQYERLLEARTQPHRRAMKTENMDNDVALEIMRGVYADSIILHWETKNTDGQWVVGIEAPPKKDDKGNPVYDDSPLEILPYTRENVIQTMETLPEVLNWFVEDANKLALYRVQFLEDDSKN